MREDAVILEDLRPVDSNPQLEYSYRPLDKISQFWAGPSYWKLRRTRSEQRSSSNLSSAAADSVSMQQHSSGLEKSSSMMGIVHQLNNRCRKGNNVIQRKKFKLIEFDKLDDYISAFLKTGDTRYKDRKVNFQKWDAKKLRLPNDHKLTIDDICAYTLNKFIGRDTSYTQQLRQKQIVDNDDDDDGVGDNGHDMGFPDTDNDVGELANNYVEEQDIMSANMNLEQQNTLLMDGAEQSNTTIGNDHGMELGVVSEIPTDYLNAPVRVERILLPFAKRAKIIDMKNLKRCCSMLLVKEIRQSSSTNIDESDLEVASETDSASVASNRGGRDDEYEKGAAQFSKIYKQLPQILDAKNAEVTSFAIAFYAVLHLANEQNLHLFQQPNLQDFHIRKLK